MNYLEKLIPEVITKEQDDCKFNPILIKESLLKETSLTEEQVDIIVEDSTRFIIETGNKIKKLTAPMIREIVNVMLVKHGLEYHRLEYTRIGIPYKDMEQIILKANYPDREVANKVLQEFNNVLKLIKQIKENGNNDSNDVSECSD